MTYDKQTVFSICALMQNAMYDIEVSDMLSASEKAEKAVYLMKTLVLEHIELREENSSAGV